MIFPRFLRGVILVIALKYYKLFCFFLPLGCDFFCIFSRLVWKNLKAVLKFHQQSCVKVGKNFLVSFWTWAVTRADQQIKWKFSLHPLEFLLFCLLLIPLVIFRDGIQGIKHFILLLSFGRNTRWLRLMMTPEIARNEAFGHPDRWAPLFLAECRPIRPLTNVHF